MSWTPEIFERAVALWKDGKSASEVAARIKSEFRVSFTRNAVVGKMHRTGNKRNDEVPTRNATRWDQRTAARPDTRADLMTARIRARQKAPARLAAKPVPVKAKPSLRLSILDLARKQCRFATHETPDGDHEFCGHETADGSSYCPAHKAVTIDAKRTEQQRRRKKRRDDPDLTALRTAQRNAGLMRVFG